MIQNLVRKYLNSPINGPKMVPKWFQLVLNRQKWSRLVQIQYKIYSQVEKMGVTHEKMGFGPQKP